MGRPKKVKRAYHRKAVQESDNSIITTEEPKIELKEEESSKLSEKLMEAEDKIEPKKKQHQMFHNLEEGRIELEETERINKENAKKAEAAAIEKARIEGANKPKLICPFCSHVQYSINSKDLTSAWCEVCGRCFQAIWK